MYLIAVWWQSGGRLGDKSATIYFQALLGEHLLDCAAIEFQKRQCMLQTDVLR